MRASSSGVFGFFFLASLACGGTSDPTPDVPPPVVPVPVVPVAPPPETPAAPEVLEPLDPVALQWLEVVDGTCKWRMATVPKPGTVETIADLARASCPDRWQLVTRSAPHEALLLVPGEPPVRIDLAAHTVAPLPSPPVMDAVAYRADGLVGCLFEDAEWIDPPEGSPEDAPGTLKFADATVPYTREGWEAALGRARGYRLKDGAWGMVSDEVNGLPEGTSPPFCTLPDGVEPDGIGVVDPFDNTGGHGVFMDAYEGEQPPQELKYGSWYKLSDNVVVAGDWLEGVQLNGPTGILVNGKWVVHPGIAAEDGDWLLITEQGGSLLVDPRDGSVAWKGPAAD